jgi:hypothetical protein
MSFLGLVNWAGKFIPKRSQLIKRLIDISKLQVKIYSDGQMAEIKQEVDKVKAGLGTAVALAFPDLNKTFHVFTDASELGIAGLLIQYYGDGAKVIDLVGRTLRGSEVNFTVYRKEVLAILSSVTRWDELLSRKKFIIRADNKSASFSLDKDKVQAKSTVTITKTDNAMLNKIKEYDFDIAHIKGADNIGADYLSRFPLPHDHSDEFAEDETIICPNPDNYCVTTAILSISYLIPSI